MYYDWQWRHARPSVNATWDNRMKNRGSIKAINRLEKRLEEFARLLLVRCHALSFLVFFSAYVFVLWYSGSLSIIDPSYQNNDRSELANVALALTGIAALVGASLATYELQRSTTHARRAAQATFWLDVNRRFKYAADRMHISFKHHLAEEGIFFGDARPFSNAMDLAKELKKNDS